ncbi:unnamed protein product, partial [Phaeothamnion confervicola]
MVFFGESNTSVETGFFIAFTVISGICFAISIWYVKKFPTIFVTRLTPLLCFLLTYENAVLSAGGHAHSTIAVDLAKATSAALVPLFLVILFEMAYSVHKRRSVPFCGIFFDQGHRVNTEACSWFLRNFVRIFAAGLFVLGIFVNFSVIGTGADSGEGGYLSLLNDPGWEFILFLLPVTAMALISLYISLSMWRYGNEASLVVHPTVWNRWIVLLVGSLALLLGLLSGSCCFRVTREAGMVILMISILLMYGEIVVEV